MCRKHRYRHPKEISTTSIFLLLQQYHLKVDGVLWTVHFRLWTWTYYYHDAGGCWIYPWTMHYLGKLYDGENQSKLLPQSTLNFACTLSVKVKKYLISRHKPNTIQNVNINKAFSLKAQATTTLHVIRNKNKNKLELHVPINKCFWQVLLPSNSWVGHGTAFLQHQLWFTSMCSHSSGKTWFLSVVYLNTLDWKLLWLTCRSVMPALRQQRLSERQCRRPIAITISDI